MKIKKFRKSSNPCPLSQKQIAERITCLTRQSYKFLEMLAWKGAVNGTAI